MSKHIFFPFLLICLVLAACSPQSALASEQPAASTPQSAAEQPQTSTEGVSYAAQIQPIWDSSCGGCHGSSGGLSLESYDALMAGGRSGAMVVAGKPDDSILVKRLTGEIPPKMPRGGSLTDEQINLVRQWIEEGALNN